MAGQPMPYAPNYNYPNQSAPRHRRRRASGLRVGGSSIALFLCGEVLYARYGGYQQVYEQQYAPGQGLPAQQVRECSGAALFARIASAACLL